MVIEITIVWIVVLTLVIPLLMTLINITITSIIITYLRPRKKATCLVYIIPKISLLIWPPSILYQYHKTEIIHTRTRSIYYKVQFLPFQCFPIFCAFRLCHASLISYV